MNHPYAQPLADLFPHLMPEILLVVSACLLFIAALFKTDRHTCGMAAIAALLFALSPGYFTDAQVPGDAVFGVPFLFDSLAEWTRVVSIAAGVLFILLAWHDMPERHVADHHACVLVIVAGACLVGAAND